MVKESGESNEPVTHSFPYDLQPKGKRDTYPQILEMFKQVKMNIPLLEAIYQVLTCTRFFKIFMYY